MTMISDCTTKPTRKRRTEVAFNHQTTWTTAKTRRRRTVTAYDTVNLTGVIMQQTGLENSAPKDQNTMLILK